MKDRHLTDPASHIGCLCVRVRVCLTTRYHYLSLHMFARAFAMGKLEEVGHAWARDRLRLANPASTTAKLVEYLQPYAMLQFALGMRAVLPEDE